MAWAGTPDSVGSEREPDQSHTRDRYDGADDCDDCVKQYFRQIHEVRAIKRCARMRGLRTSDANPAWSVQQVAAVRMPGGYLRDVRRSCRDHCRCQRYRVYRSRAPHGAAASSRSAAPSAHTGRHERAVSAPSRSSFSQRPSGPSIFRLSQLRYRRAGALALPSVLPARPLSS